jgi:acetyl esterase/lipase
MEMYERVDDKGKVFTPRVRTASVEVDIVTVHGIVHGFVHVKPDQRIKDELNNQGETFLAVTGATLRGHLDASPRQVEFVAVNKSHIITVVPVGESRPYPDE